MTRKHLDENKSISKVHQVSVKHALGFYFHRSHKFHLMSLDWTPIRNKAKLLRESETRPLWSATKGRSGQKGLNWTEQKRH